MQRLIWLFFIIACKGTQGVGVSSASAEAPAERGGAMEQQVERGGMLVRWYIEGERLFVTMKAPTTGWVAVGFNTLPTLDGSLLILGAVEGAVTRVEEHIAQPPKHPTRASLGGATGLERFEAKEAHGETEVSFVLDLSQRDGVAPALSQGDPVHLTLAFSQEDDFAHHSMMRTSAPIKL